VVCEDGLRVDGETPVKVCPNCGAVLFARPRSTGYRSQCNRFRGHCADIAAQVLDGKGEPAYTEREIAEAMKRMAVEEGWPTHLSVDGIEEPMSESTATVEQEDILLKVQQRFADLNDLFLTEYDDSAAPPIPYRSKGGRTRQEMEAMK
jgi:hypothetical protein